LLLTALALVCAWGGGALAQAELDQFPPGLTLMTWTLSGLDVPTPQTLSLEIEGLPGDRYHIKMTMEAEGQAEELGTLGFLGSGWTLHTAGGSINLEALLTLIRRRHQLEVGKEYLLPGGGVFVAQRREEIAGVECLIGTYTTPEEPDTVVELGLALSHPVYFLPLLRVITAGEVTLQLLLVDYQAP
jgi:hypothetical protein